MLAYFDRVLIKCKDFICPMTTLSGPYRMKGLAALRVASDVIVSHNHSLSHVPRVDIGSREFTPTRREDLIGGAASATSRD